MPGRGKNSLSIKREKYLNAKKKYLKARKAYKDDEDALRSKDLDVPRTLLNKKKSRYHKTYKTYKAYKRAYKAEKAARSE